MKTDKILFSENKKLSSWHDLIHLTYDKVLINIKKNNPKNKECSYLCKYNFKFTVLRLFFKQDLWLYNSFYERERGREQEREREGGERSTFINFFFFNYRWTCD